MKYIYILTLSLLCFLPSKGVNIVAAEYFFDTDPGVGNGTPLNIGVSSATIDFTASITVPANLKKGEFHYLYIRTKDANGKWSLIEARRFYVYGEVNAAEYFFDTDPGAGSGISLSIGSSGDTIDFNAAITVPVTLLKGTYHYLYIRTKDSQNKWSIIERRRFYLKGDVISGEYFFDIDPGIGNGTAFSLASPSDSIDYTSGIIPPLLSEGIHSVSYRFKDNLSKWSIAEGREYYQCGLLTTIQQGNSVTYCSPGSVQLNALVPAPSSYNIQCNGINSCIKIPDHIYLQPTDFTIEAYFKATTFSGNIVAKEYGPTTDDSYVIWFSSNGTLSAATNGGIQLKATGILLNTWYHVAFVKSGTDLSLYINGILISSDTGSASPSYDNSSVFIGADDNDDNEIGDNTFDGYIDEVRIWNVARSQAQISASMNYPISGVATGLVGYWRLDDGSGNVAKDFSSTRNNGTLINSPTWQVSTSPVQQYAVSYLWSPAADLSSATIANPFASPSSTTIYTVTATQTGTGCSSSSSITVNVNTPPTLSCPSNITLYASADCCSKIVSFASAVATGNPTPVINYSQNSGTLFPVGTTQVNVTAINGCNPNAACSFNVTVLDTIKPSMPDLGTANFTLNPGTCQLNYNGIPNDLIAPTVSDNCNIGLLTASVTGATTLSNLNTIVGQTLNFGINYITWTVTDVNGNSTSKTKTVYIHKLNNVHFQNCPLNISQCNPTVTWIPPIVTTDCGSYILTSNKLPGDSFPTGNTIVIYTATDLAGDIYSCSFTVTITPKPIWYHDNDNDGYGNANDSIAACNQISGYVSIAGDCNDNNNAVHPGATEICDGIDDDCDNIVDELNAVGCTIFFKDVDGDGYGLPGDSICSCSPLGYYAALNGNDCNDTLASIHPGAIEICNNVIDDNCDNIIDNCFLTLNLNVLIEGYYTGNGNMRAVLYDINLSIDTSATDTLIVELHETVAPYNLVQSVNGILHIDGRLTVAFTNILPGQHYYIAIKGRNIIETWSKTPITIAPVMNYDFIH